MDPQPKPIKVSLVGKPDLPLETLWYVWHQSRHNGPMMSPQDCDILRREARCDDDYYPIMGRAEAMLPLARTEEHPDGYPATREGLLLFQKEFEEVTSKIILEGIPCAENLHFTFCIENLPVFAREQMVRHRIGVHFDGRIGVDIIPDLADSSWWSQTMRVVDKGHFYDEGEFFIPESILGDPGAEDLYRGVIRDLQETYNALVSRGVPREDARCIFPMAMTHRLTWNLNLSAIKHTIGKRTCWISQYGVWEQIVSGMAEELSKVDPVFSKIVNPPCIKGDTWVSCPFNHTNVTRVQGTDPFPPCPLWLHHNWQEAVHVSRSVIPVAWHSVTASPEVNHGSEYGVKVDGVQTAFPGGWVSLDQLQAAQMEKGREVFRRFWNRDVDTGEPLS